MDTKEIARALGLAPNTVKNHIDAGKAKLGVGSRLQAARIVRNAMREREFSTPSSLASLRDFAPASSLDLSRLADPGRHYLREDHIPFDLDMAMLQVGSEGAGTGVKVFDATVGERLLLIMAITLGCAICFGSLLAGIEALSALFRT
ncbi:helix-turn-helix domain-containing protein [Sphingomonas paeninsulae]|nr:helix-turn-helix transcriptional regulator [Sphingomonas paeninsulae]